MTNRKPIDWTRIPFTHQWGDRVFGIVGHKWVQRALNTFIVVMLALIAFSWVVERTATICLDDRPLCESISGRQQ